MKFYDAKEAGSILGISSVRVTQVLKADCRTTRADGMGPNKCLYKMSTIKKEQERRLKQLKEEETRYIAQELKQAPRPSEAHLSLSEAHRYLKRRVSKQVITDNVICVHKGKTKFFLISDLDKLPANAKRRPRKNKKLVSRRCSQCGVTTNKQDGICRTCAAQSDTYGVMIKQKLSNRTCTICGKRLYMNQYKCDECTEDRKPEFYDQEESYADDFAGQALLSNI